MRRSLTPEALVEPPGGALLHQIALVLRDRQLDPESLVWSWFRRGNLVVVRLTLRPADAKRTMLISAQLRMITEMVHVTLCDLNGQPAPGSAPPLTRAPCLHDNVCLNK